jgi:hypothetical protein
MRAHKIGPEPSLDKARAAAIRRRRMDYPIREVVDYARKTWEQDAWEYLMKQPNERSAI